MTYDETIDYIRRTHDYDVFSACFDYYRSIVNNSLKGKKHFIITTAKPNAEFDEEVGLGDNYNSSDEFMAEGMLHMVEPISDYETLLDENGNFDRNKAVRYF